MREIIIGEYNGSTVLEKDVFKNSPIFAKKDDIPCGMVEKDDDGWIVRIGGDCGMSGHYPTRQGCIERGISLGYKFYTK